MLHPSENDIFQALLELVEIENTELTNIQKQFKILINDYGWDRTSKSRISNNFLNIYKNLIK